MRAENAPDPDLALVTRGLTKRFGGFTAVGDVSFTVAKGEILGLILATVFGWGNVTSTATDTVSILTMEVVDNLVMWLVPGAMDAGLLDALFWGSMSLSLVIAYFAAYPVNKALLRRGKGHAITHHASGGGPMDNRPLAYGISAFMLGGFVASLGTLL